MNTEMQIINVVPGSPEWHAHRQDSNNASDVPAAKGVSPYTTRSEYLKRRATGISPEVDPATQRRFDAGHAAEAAARPFAEKIIGEELFPATGIRIVDGVRLSASFDGLTMMGGKIFECKLWNEGKAAFVRDGMIPPQDHGQVVQQLVISKADACLYMVTDGTEERTVHTWVTLQDGDEKELLATWRQVEQDLAAYEHTEAVVAPVAAPIKDLPAIIITATGSLSVETNFTQWEIELRDFIARIPEKPSTDQEFADCKAAVGAFKAAEAALDAEEARVLTMVPSVDDMRRQKKLLRDLSSTTRLALEKLVVRRDVDVKNEIVQGARTKYIEHVTALNTRLGGHYMPAIPQGFAEAMKSKRSYATMRDAVDAALANAKIEASAIADTIEANRREMTGELDWSFLFPDFTAVCTKAADDFNALLMARIAKHNEAQAAKDKAAKDAEDSRVAAAVEAERKAGEARAAAAVEAERMAEAKRVAEAAAAVEAARLAEVKRVADQAAIQVFQEKTAAGNSATPPQAPAAIIEVQRGKTEPVGETLPALASTPPTSIEYDIDNFIALLPMTDTEKRAHRLTVVKWEKYRVALLMREAA